MRTVIPVCCRAVTRQCLLGFTGADPGGPRGPWPPKDAEVKKVQIYA